MDLRKAARYQRHLPWFFLIAVAAEVVMIAYAPLVRVPSGQLLQTLALVAVRIAMVVYVTNMLAALGTHIVVRILFIVLLLAPCLNIIMLLLANQVAFNRLRKAGLHVGLMGVSDEQVLRRLGAYRCRTCGYTLIGNTSGRCPECGTPTGSDAPPTTPA